MTIKTQGGKVITKDGKVSCECCCDQTCSCSPFCGFTQIQVQDGKILDGCNDGEFFCDLFSWNKAGYGSVDLDTSSMIAVCNISGFGFGSLFETTSPYGTYSNGVTIVAV
jgi:hypothetical protein